MRLRAALVLARVDGFINCISTESLVEELVDSLIMNMNAHLTPEPPSGGLVSFMHHTTLAEGKSRRGIWGRTLKMKKAVRSKSSTWTNGYDVHRAWGSRPLQLSF